jgi:hypothetical protein
VHLQHLPERVVLVAVVVVVGGLRPPLRAGMADTADILEVVVVEEPVRPLRPALRAAVMAAAAV